MKKIIISLSVVLFAATSSFGQNNSFLWTYDMGMPLGNTSDYMSTYSWRGMGMEWRTEYNLNITYGFSTAWSTFYESEQDVSIETDEGITLSGNQYRYINTIPLLLTGQYRFQPGDIIDPWIGLGVGTHWFKSRTEMGLWAAEIDSWNFAIDPEIGMIYDTRGDTDIIIALRYNYLFSNKKYDLAQSYLSIKVGFAFR